MISNYIINLLFDETWMIDNILRYIVITIVLTSYDAGRKFK